MELTNRQASIPPLRFVESKSNALALIKGGEGAASLGNSSVALRGSAVQMTISLHKRCGREVRESSKVVTASASDRVTR